MSSMSSSQLEAREFDFSLGPTRHAYFNVRVAETMTVLNGGVIRESEGRGSGEGGAAGGTRWVNCEGPVGGGHYAGIAVLPHPEDHPDLSWFVTDWGVITVGPFRLHGQVVRRGEVFRARYRVAVYDGNKSAAEVETLLAAR